MVVIQFGRLYMREFQLWMASLGLDQTCHEHQTSIGYYPVQEGSHISCVSLGLGLFRKFFLP